LPVLTDSMSPLIHSGDLVLVNSISPEDIGFSDIVVFWRNENLVVHRVLKKWQTSNTISFIEQGDAAYTYSVITGDKIVGKVSRIKQKGMVLDLHSPFVRPVNIVLSAWLLWTTDTFNVLRFSRSTLIRRIGRYSSRLVIRVISFFVRVGIILWYPIGLFTRIGKTVIPQKLSICFVTRFFRRIVD
jgi:signal peptidase I